MLIGKLFILTSVFYRLLFNVLHMCGHTAIITVQGFHDSNKVSSKIIVLSH